MTAKQSVDRMMAQNARKIRLQQAGRLQASKINGGASAVTHRHGSTFTVIGRTGTRYTCRAQSRDVVECDCRAGLNFGSNSCWHAAATYLWILMFQANRDAVRSAA